MSVFKVGDTVVRKPEHHTQGWIKQCERHNIKLDQGLVVKSCDKDGILQLEGLHGYYSDEYFNFKTTPYTPHLKVGDKVVRRSTNISSSWAIACKDAGIEKDSVVTISHIDSWNSDNLCFEELKHTGKWSAECFIKVETKMFKVGDKVVRLPEKQIGLWLSRCEDIKHKPYGCFTISKVVDSSTIELEELEGVLLESGNFKLAIYDTSSSKAEPEPESTKFKIGDKVQRVEDDNSVWRDTCKSLGFNWDSVFTVKEVSSAGNIIIEGMEHRRFWSKKRFILVNENVSTETPAYESLTKPEPIVFNVGDKVQRVKDDNSVWWNACKKLGLNWDSIFTIKGVNSVGNISVEGMDHFYFWNKKSYVLVGRNVAVETVLNKSQIKEENVMALKRRVVDVVLLDNDKGLDVSLALVAQYKGVVTEDDDATTIQEIMMNHNIAAKLKAHNEKRVAQVDMSIRENHGTEVKLQPVRLKDLTWVVQ